MCADWGLTASVNVRSDSSVAIGMSNRLGLGGQRHLSVRHLRVQHKAKEKEISRMVRPVIIEVMNRLGYRFERQPLHGALKV